MRRLLLIIPLFIACIVVHAQRNKQIGKLSDGMTWVKKDGKYGFLNEKGTLVIPYKYDSVRSFTEGLAAVKVDTNWFYINKQDSVAHWQFDYNSDENEVNKRVYYKMARPFHHGLAVVLSHEEFPRISIVEPIGYTDRFGDWGCDSLGDFTNGFAEVVYGDEHGIIDVMGDDIVPADYEDVDSFSNGWVKAKLRGQWMLLNPYGECVKNCLHGVKTPKRFSADFNTIYFPNLFNQYEYDRIQLIKIKSLISFMEQHPKQRMVVIGNGNDSYVAQQRSWDYVYGIIQYVVTHSDIKRDQFIFQYGRFGRHRTVNIRKAHPNEFGPNNVPPPVPYFTNFYKDGKRVEQE